MTSTISIYIVWSMKRAGRWSPYKICTSDEEARQVVASVRRLFVLSDVPRIKTRVTHMEIDLLRPKS